MKDLEHILEGIDYTVFGKLPKSVTSLANDSRKVKKGSLFFAIRGTSTDGHKYLDQAVNNDASAVVVEEKSDLDIPQIIVENSRTALSRAAKNFYNDPTSKLKLIGITGTNGKTSTVYILRQILNSAQIPNGSVGTLGYTIKDQHFDSSLTTPDIIDLQKTYRKMVAQNVKIAIMEVSSHALAMKRVEDIHFQGVCFTNISQDHLDFHKNMDNYASTKARLFGMVDSSGFAISSIDSQYSHLFIDNCMATVHTFSMEKDADYTWSADTTFHNTIKGRIRTPDQNIKIECPLSGKFNLQNILAAVAIADQLEIKKENISKAMAEIESVPGRLQEITAQGQPRIFIDYAHTPDAILNVLEELHNITPENGQLKVIYGCGGNRDRAKRPLMTQAVEKYADLPILTTDNPRFEEPEDIISHAEQGFSENSDYQIIINRKEAIQNTLKNSSQTDIIAILGKGHETYQEIKGKKYPFSDFKIVQEWIDENN
ncbi:MAG TPA: UDP-N-acetylmuramoyl-L-alanyl-D-glutamate--2,6-diaminopimelate ligase [bacterium]|nr:UDP-N-acetylmuramoyl-L-alanyl-D-glutamate--2,6-diaminopimelate ligase [bacterium]